MSNGFFDKRVVVQHGTHPQEARIIPQQQDIRRSWPQGVGIRKTRSYDPANSYIFPISTSLPAQIHTTPSFDNTFQCGTKGTCPVGPLSCPGFFSTQCEKR